MIVMIGVDDSPCSRAALDFVGRFSWPALTRVTIVSCVALPAPAYMASYTPANMQFETWLDALTKLHEDVVARDEVRLRTAGLEVASRVLQGDARDTLVAEAAREHADLLVVGSHGRTGIDKLLMGSVASHVVTHAPCSVLVVKLPANRTQQSPDAARRR